MKYKHPSRGIFEFMEARFIATFKYVMNYRFLIKGSGGKWR